MERNRHTAEIIPLHRGARIVGSFDEAIQGDVVHLPELALLGSRRHLSGAAIKDYPERIEPVDAYELIDHADRVEFDRSLNIIGWGLLTGYLWIIILRVAQLVFA